MPKTNAEICRQYRRKKNENKIKIKKKPPKSSTERNREFRARKKLLLNNQNRCSNITVNITDVVNDHSQQQNSVPTGYNLVNNDSWPRRDVAIPTGVFAGPSPLCGARPAERVLRDSCITSCFTDAVPRIQYKMASHTPPDHLNLIKNEYYRRLKNCLQFSTKPPLSRFIVTDLIKGMLACEKNPKNISTISCIDKYTVHRKKNRYMLKMRQDDGQVLVVVPWEDSFPFVWNCHAGKGHLTVLQTHEAIKSKYVVESVCVESLTQICSCSSFNKYVYLSIVELSTTVNDCFTHILLYEDCYTGYVQIKPIPNISVNEIALELIKIFCDIGPPFLIYSKVPGGMDELSEVLNSVWKQSNIIIYVFNTEDRTTSCKILELMSDWLRQIPEGGKTYYYAWHVIQNKYNNTNNGFGLSPFERAFPYLNNTKSGQVVLTGQTDNTDWSKIEEVIDIDEKIYIIEINDLGLTEAEGADTTIDDTAEKETSDQSKNSNNEDSDKDDDIEIIENKTELIILNDDDDGEDEVVRSNVQLCIRCKMNIEGDVNICERCRKSVHEKCSLYNERTGSLFCLPCTEILTHIDALTKRKEEFKWLLECINDDIMYQ